jgi:hypothetical protein
MSGSADITVALTDALDGIAEWAIILKPDGTIVWSNRAFREFAGAGEFSDAFTNLRQIFPTDFDELMADIHEVIASGDERAVIQKLLQAFNSEKKIIRLTTIAHQDASGAVKDIIVCGLDITEQMEMEQFKKDAYTQIEKNIEQFAVLGDHIRNPLAAIIGLSDLMDDKTTGGKIHTLAKEIDDIITRIDKGWIDSEKVRLIIRKYYDIGAAGTHELAARAIHDEYIEQQKISGATPESNPSMRPWNELPHRLKDSNLRQAGNIWKTLHMIHCAIGFSVASREPPFEFTRSELEFLAERAHEQWVDERIKKGWAYGKVRNDLQKIHDCIVPWDKLPEEQRDKDRNAARTLPVILAKVNLKIIRLDKDNTNNLTAHITRL